WAGYDQDNKRIELGFKVSLSISVDISNDATVARMVTSDACANILDDAREYALIAAGRWTHDSAQYAEAAEYALRVWFSHNSIRRGKEPSQLYRALSKITFVVVKLNSVGSANPSVECSSALRGGPVTTILQRNPD